MLAVCVWNKAPGQHLPLVIFWMLMMQRNQSPGGTLSLQSSDTSTIATTCQSWHQGVWSGGHGKNPNWIKIDKNGWTIQNGIAWKAGLRWPLAMVSLGILLASPRLRWSVWQVDVEKLDYHHYLPIFFDGSKPECCKDGLRLSIWGHADSWGEASIK